MALWPPPLHCSLDHEAWAIEEDSEQVIGPSKSMLLHMLPRQNICSGQRGPSRRSLLVSVPAHAGGGEDPAEAETQKDTAKHLLQTHLAEASELHSGAAS